MVFCPFQQKCWYAQIQENKPPWSKSMTSSPWGCVEESRKLIRISKTFRKYSKEQEGVLTKAQVRGWLPSSSCTAPAFNACLCFAGHTGSSCRKSLWLPVHRRMQRRIFAHFSSKPLQDCSLPSESVEGLPLTSGLKSCPKQVWEMMSAWAENDSVRMASAGQDLEGGTLMVLYRL